jgi:hypothetical protein
MSNVDGELMYSVYYWCLLSFPANSLNISAEHEKAVSVAGQWCREIQPGCSKNQQQFN